MSDLYRTAMSARLAKLPPDLPPAMDGEHVFGGGDPLGLGGDFVTRAPGYEEEGACSASAFPNAYLPSASTTCLFRFHHRLRFAVHIR